MCWYAFNYYLYVMELFIISRVQVGVVTLVQTCIRQRSHVSVRFGKCFGTVILQTIREGLISDASCDWLVLERGLAFHLGIKNVAL